MQRRPWEAAKLLHAWQQQHVNPKEYQSAKLKAMNAKRILHNLAATDTITKNTAVNGHTLARTDSHDSCFECKMVTSVLCMRCIQTDWSPQGFSRDCTWHSSENRLYQKEDEEVKRNTAGLSQLHDKCQKWGGQDPGDCFDRLKKLVPFSL